jgi:hypothetical protein
MRADRRARHARADLDPFGCLGDASDDAPHERTVALLVRPRMEVIRDGREVETGLLG